MRKLLLNCVTLFALFLENSAAAERTVTPRFPEDLVRIRTSSSQTIFEVREVLQKDASLEILAYEPDSPTILIRLRDENSARILANTFSWPTEMSLQIELSAISGRTIAVDQTQVLFEDVDCAMGDASRNSDGSRLVTIDELVQWTIEHR